MVVAVLELFRRSLVESAGELAGAELLPARLAKACVAALRVDGAGLSAFTPDGFRMPLGVSDDAAGVAERLRFTVGEGPCLEAHRLRVPVVAAAGELAERWPVFHAQLVAHTPFRAVVAVPLRVPLAQFGTLDLMTRDPRGSDVLDLDEVDAVVAEIAHHLLGQSIFAGEQDLPWTRAPAAERRRWVFIACGMLNSALEINTDEALLLLQDYAFRTDRSIDDIAYDIVHRRLPTDELREAP